MHAILSDSASRVNPPSAEDVRRTLEVRRRFADLDSWHCNCARPNKENHRCEPGGKRIA